MRFLPRPDLADISTRYRSNLTYVLVFTTATVALLGLVTAILEAPVIFPPIAATIFILFAFPLAEESHPRNVLGAYLVAVLAGMASVAAFGLWNEAPDLFHMRWDRLGASVLGMGLAVAGIGSLRVLHIPALAATVMVTIGLVYEPIQFAYIVVFVLLSVGIALTVNRAFGLPQTLWSDPEDKVEPGQSTRRR